MTATGYTRQSAAQIVTGNTINASDFNNEYNQLQSFADGTNGHDHSGGIGLGPKLSLTASVGGILPALNGGTGIANASTITIGGNLSISGAFTTALTVTANTTLTLPITGTLATLAGSETLSNKTLVAPALGAATATTINKVTITAPASSATLTISDGKALASSNTLTLAGTDSTTITFQGSDTYVGRTTTDTLTNKTLTSPTINTATIAGGTINNNIIGGSTPAAGTFTSATSGVITDSGSTFYSSVSGFTAGPYTLSGTGSVQLIGGAGFTANMPVLSGTTASVINAYGVKVNQGTVTGSASLTNSYGLFVTQSTNNSSTATLTNSYGAYLQSAALTNGGTTSTVYCLYAEMPTVTGASSNVANAIGIRVASPTVSSSGTINTSYGLQIQNVGSAGITNSSAIKIETQSGSSLPFAINSNGFSLDASGNINAVAGSFSDNLTVTTAAKGLVLKRGSNGKCGTFVANGATPVTVSNTSIAITDVICISLNTAAGTVGTDPAVKTITAGVGFTVAGIALDTSTYNYVIISNAA